MLIVISLAACCATVTGGILALRPRRRYYLIQGLGAGAVIGVACFDLLPEARELAGSAAAAGALAALGFLAYAGFDGLSAHGTRQGALAAASLTVHSFLDGFSIGLAFKVSAAAGAIVAVGVVVHDIFDGLNTVSVVITGKGSRRAARAWLAADAVAPVVGAAATLGLAVAARPLGLALGLFAGFFLYIGAVKLLPPAVREGGPAQAAALSLAGAVCLLAAVRLASL